MEILGEPEVEWREIMKTRDKLIHSYSGLNVKILWRIVKNDIPLLTQKLVSIFSKEVNNSKNGLSR